MPASPACRFRRPSSVRLGSLLAGVVAVGTAVALAGSPAARAGDPEAGSTSSLGEALAPSTAVQKALSEHLRRQGALFYGAWWCPACFRQKHLFGQEAGNSLPYVECDKSDSGRDRCKTAGIEAYPTWVLGERRLVGVQSLEELGRWSGFDGDLPGGR